MNLVTCHFQKLVDISLGSRTLDRVAMDRGTFNHQHLIPHSRGFVSRTLPHYLQSGVRPQPTYVNTPSKPLGDPFARDLSLLDPVREPFVGYQFVICLDTSLQGRTVSQVVWGRHN